MKERKNIHPSTAVLAGVFGIIINICFFLIPPIREELFKVENIIGLIFLAPVYLYFTGHTIGLPWSIGYMRRGELFPEPEDEKYKRNNR